MKKTKFMILLIALFFLLTGCLEKAPEVLVCNNIPADNYSVLCSVSNHLNIPLEEVSRVLKIANVVGLGADVYTAQQADAFMKSIRAFIIQSKRQGLLYGALMNFVETKYGLLPNKVKASIVLVRQLSTVDLSLVPGSDRFLSDYDYKLLFLHLDKQEEIIKPFLDIQ